MRKSFKLVVAMGAVAGMLGFGAMTMAQAGETIGAVDTSFQLIGPNHKVVVEVFDDPQVNGVSCYVSHAKTGGIGGALGLASDKSEASIACRQIAPISFNGALKHQDNIFSESTSPLFKHLNVIRMVDSKRNVLTYLTISDTLIDGSPKNSITAVPVDKAIPVR